MQMLTKFESKSSRAKGVAFHPKRPWILVSLHSSTIQLWDYRMGTLIDRFEEHDGPVRGVDFHRSQPLFVSGGDDYKVKVWSLQTRRCLFTLTGHLDYVRTVFFHNELPWILSASDDQTIRIWNWQNRSQIACLTGHNHYVMCAQFHPRDDLIVSASLDQTVRVWDISGLRKKHSAPTTMTFEDQMARANAVQTDMFGNTDAIVKYVLEGHDRAVNWVAFHPTLPLIVSAGDDRMVKLWKMSETKAWEVDTCRGHFNNVSCCLFHPHQDLIISVGEDKTIRTWDLNKRTPVQSFRRESDRFWVIASHPEINLFAAGHDSGVMVFKLERERPASTVYQNMLFYVNKEKQVKSFDFQTGAHSMPLLSLKKFGHPWTPPRSISYNPAERSILVTSSADNGIYELISLPREAVGGEPANSNRGTGNSAVFIARNRFAVFTKATQTIEVKDLSNVTTKSIKTPTTVNHIFYGGTGSLLLFCPSSVVLFDIQQKKVISELLISGVKHAVWSNDGHYIALLSKHTITIATKTLESVASLHETIRLKSAAWDETGVLLYSTLNHIKYALLNGDNGIIKTLQSTVYLIKVKNWTVYCLNRDGTCLEITIDPTEYRFKKALVNKNYSDVLRIIKNSSLVGQSIIAYVRKKGYPEIALQLVQDPQTRFDLATECGNLDVALEQARKIDNVKVWKILGEQALDQGNHEILELVLQKLQEFDKLSFLYLVIGQESKLERMSKISEHRGDFSARFQNSLYLGDANGRCELLKEAKLYPLAYALAKSNGLDDQITSILELSGLSEEDFVLPTLGTPLETPKVQLETYKSNWPLHAPSQSVFEKALLGLENLTLEEEGTDEAVPDKSRQFQNLEEAEEEDLLDVDETTDGWDLGDDADYGVESEVVDNGTVEETDKDGVAISELDLWVRNSPLPADHAAAGSFDSAMQLLNRQIAVVAFAPLKPHFIDVYQASKLYLHATEGLPSLVEYVRRSGDTTDTRKILPAIPYNIANLKANELEEAFKLVRGKRLEEAINLFRNILYSIILSICSTQTEVDEAQKLIVTCREYILGLSLERERDSLPDTEAKRKLELASYFTKAKLKPAHMVFALQIAMKQATKVKNFSLASTFASRLLELVPKNTPRAADARKVIAAADANPHDAIEIDYDQFAEFDICPATFTPIYGGSPYEVDPLTGAKYVPSEKGKLCSITKITQIGAPASGLRLKI